MTRRTLPGVWYVDALGDTFCGLRWDHTGIETHLGLLPLPGDDVLFLALAGAPFRFAGQAHNTTDPAAYEWNDGWRSFPPPACGTNPCIYDAAGALRRSDCSIGSQGWRYVDDSGRLVTGDETLVFNAGGRLIHEWTAYDGLVVGQGHEGGVQVWDGSALRLLHPGACYNIRWRHQGSQTTVAFYEVAPDGLQAYVYSISFAELRSLPVIDPPRPIGPVSDARPADGRVYDLLPYWLGAASTWPRKGPTHPMHQVDRNGVVYFVKFGDIAPGGEPHETWAYDQNWIYHLEDASSGDPYSFTDLRMFPRSMAIGEAHAFDTGPHESVWRTRATCVENRREPWRRTMWVWALYDAFYWGPDLGTRATVVLVYDATAGIHGPGRYIELGYYAKGAGSCRWESYRSEDVYRTGHADFTGIEVMARSDFYLQGGPAVQPKLLGCVPQVVPGYPPWDPNPPPVGRYQTIRGHMTNERGWLIGPGDKALAMDAAGKVTFDREALTDADLLELAPIAGDHRATFRPVAHPELLLGADATAFTPGGNVCQQYYGTAGARGFYESWDVGIWASGIVTAMVPYIEQGANHGRHWGAASLTWVRQV